MTNNQKFSQWQKKKIRRFFEALITTKSSTGVQVYLRTYCICETAKEFDVTREEVRELVRDVAYELNGGWTGQDLDGTPFL